MLITRAALVLVAATAYAADRVPVEFFPPQTRIVVGVSLRSLAESGMVEMLGADPALLRSVPFAGLDIARDIDSLVIASEGTGQNSPSIAVLRGRFKPRASEISHEGVPIHMDRTKKNVALALIDANTAIAGELPEVRAALGRRGNPPAFSSSLAARAAAFASDDFWAVGDVPEAGGVPNPAGKGLQSVDRFDIGASLRNGLRLHGSIHLRSPQEAEQVAAAVKLFEAMFNAQPSKSGAKFDLRAEGGTINVDLTVPKEELRKSVAARKGLLADMLKSQIPFPGASAPGGPARDPISRPPSAPATIVTNTSGETVQVTLPGAK